MLRSHTTQSYRLKIGSAILSYKGIYWGDAADERLANQSWRAGGNQGTPRREQESEKKSQNKSSLVCMPLLTQSLPESVRRMQMTLEFCHYYFLTVARQEERKIHPSHYHAPSYPVSA